MTLLDELSVYMNESGNDFVLSPANYIDTDGVSYEVYGSDDHSTKLADISIKMIDGEPIDAINSDYTYDDVYADVTIEIPNDSLSNWVVDKMKVIGFSENPILINGEEFSIDNDDDSTMDDDSSTELSDALVDDIEDDIEHTVNV